MKIKNHIKSETFMGIAKIYSFTEIVSFIFSDMIF